MKTLCGALLICSLTLIDARATGFAVDPSGNLFFLGANPGRIFKFSPDGAVTKFATDETDEADEDWSDIAIDTSGNIFVSMTGRSERGDIVVSILKFTPAGQRSTFIKNAGPGQPNGLAIDRAADLFVGIAPITKSSDNGAIFKFEPKRTKTLFAHGLPEAARFACDPQGNLFVIVNREILKFTPKGEKSVFATGGASDIAIDRSANLFVADRRRNMIEKLDPAGAMSEFANVDGVWFLAFNPAGDLFVLANAGILKFAPDGTRTVFAKNPVEQSK